MTLDEFNLVCYVTMYSNIFETIMFQDRNEGN